MAAGAGKIFKHDGRLSARQRCQNNAQRQRLFAIHLQGLV